MAAKPNLVPKEGREREAVTEMGDCGRCFGSEPGWSPWCHSGEFREAAGQSDFKGLDTGAGLPGMFDLSLSHFLAV